MLFIGFWTLSLIVPSLPFVDDEYIEQVAVYQSVLRAKKVYVVAELGARWGTWGARSIAFLKARRPELQYSLYLVEIDKENCEGIRRVMQKNQFEYTLDCQAATAASVSRWIRSHARIDLIDMDIQSAEMDLLTSTIGLMNERVVRIIVGTHSPAIHSKLMALFKQHDWIFIWTHSFQKDTKCVDNYLRGHTSADYPKPERFNWSKLIERGCVHDTPRGPVANWDGEIIVDNPRFVDRLKVFHLTDKELHIDELLEENTE